MRMHAGDKLVSWLDNLVQKKITPMPNVPKTYDFDIFEHASDMHKKYNNKIRNGDFLELFPHLILNIKKMVESIMLQLAA